LRLGLPGVELGSRELGDEITFAHAASAIHANILDESRHLRRELHLLKREKLAGKGRCFLEGSRFDLGELHGHALLR
jgi:hypothetical protein